MQRREFLHVGLLSSAAVLCRQRTLFHWTLSPHELTQSASTGNRGVETPASLAPYVTPLAVPPVIEAGSGQKISIGLREAYQPVLRDLKPTRIWGYNGMWPGPTLRVRRDQPLTVKWRNELPVRHFLPIDNTLHGAEGSLPEVRTVAHLHGAQVMPDSDGYPEAWSTSDGRTGPSYSST